MPNELSSLPHDAVQRTVLGNGLTVLIHEDHSAPVAAVVTYVKAGYFDETDDVVGIAHVLEHMYFKGTTTRGVGEIAKQTKASGGYLNAATIYDHTSYYAVLPIAGFETGLRIQADAYANSVVDAAELERELEVIIEEARRKEDNPGAVATETLYELLHDRHRIRRWRIGREAGLRALRRNDLLGFYRNFYRPRNTILVVAGDVHAATLLPLVEELYGTLPDDDVVRTPGPGETGRAGRRYRELTGDIAQAHVTFGWRTPGIRAADTPALDLAASVLSAGRSSRLYRAVRERRLASSVSAYNYTPTELGVFVLHADGDPAHTRDAARALWTEWRALLDDGVAPAEIERARRLFEARWLRRLETMEGQANFLAEWEALGDWRLADEYARRYLSLAPNEVQEAAQRHLTGEDVSLLVYRPETAEPFVAAGDSPFAALERSAPAPVAGVVLPPARSAPALAIVPAAECVHRDISVFRTARGVPIFVRRKPGTPIVHLGVYARGGASREPEAYGGLATLLARTTLKGTHRRPAEAIALESELLGGSISPSVTSDGIGWTISVPAAHLGAAVELLADVVLSPAIPDDAFETERAVALSQLAQLRDDMFRYPVRLAGSAAFGTHPYGRGVLASEAALRAASAADARAWHEREVVRSDAVIALVGDVDPATAAAELSHAFAALEWAGIPALEAPVWPAAVTVLHEQRDKAQTALALAFPGPARGDDARTAAHLLAGVASGLGGRFFDELRDRQSLAYTVHVTSNDRVAAGMFLSYIATSPEKEDVARAGLLREFDRLREEPVGAEELERARTYALGTHAIAQQSGGHLLAALVDAHLYGGGIEELDTVEARVRAVTPEAILALARRYFDPSRRVEGIVRGRPR